VSAELARREHPDAPVVAELRAGTPSDPPRDDVAPTSRCARLSSPLVAHLDGATRRCGAADSESICL